jgi:hypothetical protein
MLSTCSLLCPCTRAHTHARAHRNQVPAHGCTSSASPSQRNTATSKAHLLHTRKQEKAQPRLDRIAKSQRTCIVSRSRWHVRPLGPGPDSNIQTLTLPAQLPHSILADLYTSPPSPFPRTQSRTPHNARYTSDVFRVTSARLCHVHLCLAAGGACACFLLAGVVPSGRDRVWGGGMGRRFRGVG